MNTTMKVGRKYVTILKDDLNVLKKAFEILDDIYTEIDYEYGCEEDKMTEEMQELYDAVQIYDYADEIFPHLKSGK